jgi:hypothetical protein
LSGVVLVVASSLAVLALLAFAVSLVAFLVQTSRHRSSRGWAFATGAFLDCYDLTYESQRENEMHRALRRAQAIRERLGGSANMLMTFLAKPKGMHWRTYERLWWEHHEAEMAQLAGMREWLDKMERQLS